MTLLRGPLKGVEGVRQLIDTVSLQNESTIDGAQAGVFEYLDNDLDNFHCTEKRRFSLNEIKTCARQLLTGLSHIHKKGIIHTSLRFTLQHLRRIQTDEYRSQDGKRGIFRHENETPLADLIRFINQDHRLWYWSVFMRFTLSYVSQL